MNEENFEKSVDLVHGSARYWTLLDRSSGSRSVAQVARCWLATACITLGVQCLVKSREIRYARASFSRRFFCVPLTVITPVQYRHLRDLTTLRVLNSASLNWGHFVAERDGRLKLKKIQCMKKYHLISSQRGRPYTYNVTLRRVRETVVPVEKAVSTYSECAFVALGSSLLCACAILSSVICLALQYFSALYHKRGFY
jgi:hypothetical protein